MFVPTHKPKLTRLALMLPVLMILLAGCASSFPVSVAPPALPPLPMEARASRVQIPSVCLLGCSNGWKATVDQSLDTLTSLE